jgi:hypothetical protein
VYLKFFLHYFRSFILKINYWLGHYKSTVWLIGDARSGTTWIASMLNFDGKLRELFEPFHPYKVKAASFLDTYERLNSATSKAKIKPIAEKVFSGNFYDIRVDRSSKSFIYKGLLIKDVFVNLFAHKISSQFPHVKVALLLRNPFAVAFSKWQTRHWNWEFNYTETLLNDPSFSEKYLNAYRELIEEIQKEENYFLNQILFWCIYNMVPLSQFNSTPLELIIYEEVLISPEVEIFKLRKNLNIGNTANYSKITEILKKPSVVSTKKAGFTENLLAWRNQIPDHIIQKGQYILDCFDMGSFYDSSGVPNRAEILKYMSKAQFKFNQK